MKTKNTQNFLIDAILTYRDKSRPPISFDDYRINYSLAFQLIDSCCMSGMLYLLYADRRLTNLPTSLAVSLYNDSEQYKSQNTDTKVILKRIHEELDQRGIAHCFGGYYYLVNEFLADDNAFRFDYIPLFVERNVALPVLPSTIHIPTIIVPREDFGLRSEQAWYSNCMINIHNTENAIRPYQMALNQNTLFLYFLYCFADVCFKELSPPLTYKRQIDQLFSMSR